MRRKIHNALILRNLIALAALAHVLNGLSQPAAAGARWLTSMMDFRSNEAIESLATSLSGFAPLFPRCDRAEARQLELRNGLHQTRRRRCRDG
jgi:hypothetical protein